MRRFFVPSHHIRNARVVIDGDEFHHLHHVLRLQIGDRITFCDDQEQEHYGTVVALSPTSAEVTIHHTESAQISRLPLTLALGLLKGQKMDLVVEKVTELGVNRIVPFISTFTVAQLPTERQSERLARWQRIAQSAAKQSGSKVPQLLVPQTFAQLCDSQSPDITTILFYEQERQSTLKAFANDHSSLASLCIIVGPEGGFASQEVEHARERGIYVLGLGSQILRAETAGIVAVALCRFLWDNATVPPLLSQANKT